ncbi:GspE/PulE family protein [Candidatus Magnetominusculus xianensis]|uniref:General secretion pathway protein GspE n=1 Tax=Candidatus Magnetominusculus xianensis TaxID=1748249 RepID=A0ABR5SCM5_9BACT|nr:GspE/PulE family protein [Candidatus Magnetominusculus xianensis]KWT75620.1 general secretion pathway protein GspE [Candidatus Magnetominusculus xianensis]MBF0403703.1 type II/IV secretion system protein [Nitrospirota bacterium]
MKKKLGEMLLESKLLTKEQMDSALKEHKKAGVRLGQFLVRSGIIAEEQIIQVVCNQLKLKKYHPEKYPISLVLESVLPYEIADRYKVVPLAKKGRLLTVAMLDPLDINAMDAVESITNHEIEPVVCTENEFNNIISNLYPAQSGLAVVMDSFEDSDGLDMGGEVDTMDLNIQKTETRTEDLPVIRLVNSILSTAIKERASDVHISPQKNNIQIRFRVDGKLVDMPPPPKVMFLPVITRLKLISRMDITVSRMPQDGRFTIRHENKEINVRVSSIPTLHGENIVLRLLDTSTGIYTLERLGMSDDDIAKLRSVIYKPYGMILSTGPTGSGKSTSLYAILNEISKPDIHVITLEDPVEYRMNGIRQVQLNTRAGMTFATGLRAILRQDPDVIMLGEVRDSETAAVAIRAAQTGHRLLSTIHTNDAAGSISRLMDMQIEPFLVSSVLLVSFAQRLVRTLCPFCKEQYSPSPKLLQEWGLGVSDGKYFRRKGCYQCFNTGYKGRTGIFEILLNDEDIVQDMILYKNTSRQITNTLVEAGRLKTLKMDAARKIVQGLTTFEEAETTIFT